MLPTVVARALAVVACSAAVVLAGCGSSGSKIPPSKLSKLVLQQADLSKGFTPFYVGHQLSADQPGTRSDPRRFGREGGWIGRYRRGGTPKTKGPLVVASRADVFKDSSGARSELELIRRQLTSPSATRVRVGDLGDEVFGFTVVQPGTVRIRNYAIVWREANATAELELNGFEGGLTLSDALALARKQEARLRAAAS